MRNTIKRVQYVQRRYREYVANKMLGIIRRNFVDLDKFSFLLLYKALVRSHLEFAGPIWNPYKKGLINDIELIQKKATKLIRYCKGMSYRERLMYLQLPTLKYRRFRGDILQVYKILNNMYDSQTVLFYHYILIHAHGVTL